MFWGRLELGPSKAPVSHTSNAGNQGGKSSLGRRVPVIFIPRRGRARWRQKHFAQSREPLAFISMIFMCRRPSKQQQGRSNSSKVLLPGSSKAGASVANSVTVCTISRKSKLCEGARGQNGCGHCGHAVLNLMLVDFLPPNVCESWPR